jgi:hypothetical protein
MGLPPLSSSQPYLVECSVEDGTCAEIAKELTFRPARSFDEENNYRYILDVVRPSSRYSYLALLSS